MFNLMQVCCRCIWSHVRKCKPTIPCSSTKDTALSSPFAAALAPNLPKEAISWSTMSISSSLLLYHPPPQKCRYLYNDHSTSNQDHFHLSTLHEGQFTERWSGSSRLGTLSQKTISQATSLFVFLRLVLMLAFLHFETLGLVFRLKQVHHEPWLQILFRSITTSVILE